MARLGSNKSSSSQMGGEAPPYYYTLLPTAAPTTTDVNGLGWLSWAETSRLPQWCGMGGSPPPLILLDHSLLLEALTFPTTTGVNGLAQLG